MRAARTVRAGRRAGLRGNAPGRTPGCARPSGCLRAPPCSHRCEGSLRATASAEGASCTGLPW
ncbi:hypothetical protein E4198_01075 [Streptomyces sp. RKND-216]|nr:hypothetical protein E4198_01075 [Streptomyces sp. RKND-216]